MFRAARIRVPFIKNLLIRIYLSLHTLNLDEAECSNAFDFPTLNAFFTRALKAGARPVDESSDNLVSPVDGTVSQAQAIEYGRIFQAKGHDFSLLELVGNQQHLAQPFSNGRFATLYLSPRDYHRIHIPCTGTLKEMVYVPGRLFSVAPFTVEAIPRLFARNERLVCHFENEQLGSFLLVLVGAINVSAIETVWAGDVVASAPGKITATQYDGSLTLDKGEEMGRFNLGSTVIAIFDDKVDLASHLTPGASVTMGQTMAHARSMENAST